ncbi:MAG: M48 family metallopeptidase [Acidobacteriota bacterium]|nr:M48 family metallopeptidase [Acidobacteriota bacterium]
MTKAASATPLTLDEFVGTAVFRAEVRAWAKRIGIQPREIRLRQMRRKWASCSTYGRLTFNTDLLREPARFRAEVIVHELLHLKVPNHGKLFRTLLRSYLEFEPTFAKPAYKESSGRPRPEAKR